MEYMRELLRALDMDSLLEMAERLIAVLLCLCVHETCHALAAYALGDPTAKREHRLSLNPLRHIDWLGFAMLVFAGFGWAKPVPVNPSYFKKPKAGMALTALAGPVSNFILALLLLLAARLSWNAVGKTGLTDFLLSTALLSTGLGLFNLVPVPPLDGSKVLFALLPDGAYRWILRYERIGMLVVLALVAAGVGSSLLSRVIYTVFLFLCRVTGL